MASELTTVRAKPCPTCPYRLDAPSGLWDASEYEKLSGFDGDVPDQLAAGALHVFLCHSTPGFLCAGWVSCHDVDNLLAVRLNHRRIDPAVYEYVSPVPLHASGAAAAEHGMRDLPEPGPEARIAARKLLRQAGRNRRMTTLLTEKDGDDA